MSVVIAAGPIAETMHGRGGFPLRTVIYAAFILLLVYMFYSYHSSQKSLREAEMTGSRYKREAEERVTEIQDLVRAKDKFQETCQNEKTELHNRIKSLNQQYSLIQSHNKETEADNAKLHQDIETMRGEHSHADSVHAAEFEKLKQERASDVTKLKDTIADLKRQNENLQQKLKETEDSNKLLEEEKVRLQHQLQASRLSPQQHLQSSRAPEVHLDKLNHPGDKDDKNKDNFGLKFEAGAEDPGFRKNDLYKLGQGQGDAANDRGVIKVGALDKEMEDMKHPGDDNLHVVHQVMPPNHNLEDIHDDGQKDKKEQGNDRPDVNPNDEQKGQILEPIIDTVDKHQGGGEDGVVAMNARKDEEARENEVKEEDGDGFHHKNPLALGQIQIPGNLNEANANHKFQQQLPPLLNDENDQKEQDRGERHEVKAINPMAPDML